MSKIVPFLDHFGHSKFIRQEAVAIYYIPWPAKKIAAQNLHTSLSARNSQKLCSLHSQLAKAAKKQTSNEHIVDLFLTILVTDSLPFSALCCILKSLPRFSQLKPVAKICQIVTIFRE
jgi:hypothetical protein